MKAEFGHSLRNQLDHFPVWDIGTRVDVGDYGVIKDDCFNKLGNIVAEYQSTLEVTQSDPDSWEFSSAGTTVTNVGAEGGVQVLGAKAKMDVKFESAYSLYIRAASSRVRSVSNLAQVTRELHAYPDGWPHQYAVVSSVRTTPSLVLLMNTKNGSSITVSADPGVLAALHGGHVSAGAQIVVTGDAGLKSLGMNGAIYVDLVYVRSWGGKPKPAGLAAAAEASDASDEPFEKVRARKSA